MAMKDCLQEGMDSVWAELRSLREERDRLTGCLAQANANHGKYERLYYLTLDERDSAIRERDEARAERDNGVYSSWTDDRAPSVRIDDAGDLLLELTLDDIRAGFIVTDRADDAGWWLVSRGGSMGSGKLTPQHVEVVRMWRDAAIQRSAPLALTEEQRTALGWVRRFVAEYRDSLETDKADPEHIRSSWGVDALDFVLSQPAPNVLTPLPSGEAEKHALTEAEVRETLEVGRRERETAERSGAMRRRGMNPSVAAALASVVQPAPTPERREVAREWFKEKCADMCAEFQSAHRDGDAKGWLLALLKGLGITVAVDPKTKEG